MDRAKFVCYGLLTVQFLFFTWLLSSMIVDGRFKTQGWNGNVFIFELILAGTMIMGAIYLKTRQLQEIPRN